MASRIITCIPSALNRLQWFQDFFYCYDVQTLKLIRILIHKLRALRTFLLCSTKFPDGGLMAMGSVLLNRIEHLVLVTMKDNLSCDVWNKVSNLLIDIESFEEEIDKWYIRLSECLLPSNSPVVINQISVIAVSVLENLDDFLSFHRVYVGLLVQPIEALKEHIAFLRNFTRFTHLLYLEGHDQSRDFLIHVEALAFSAAHLTAHLFSASHYNFKVFSSDIFEDTEGSKRNISYDGLESMISTLLMRMNPVDNPRVYEAYGKYLACSIYSRDLCISNLGESGDPVSIMEDFSVFLLSTLWNALLLGKSHDVDLRNLLQELYQGLRSLRIILKKQRNKFDDHRVMEMIGAAICDAGVIIFSLHKRASLINLSLKGFLKKLNNIRTEVGKQVVEVPRFNLPITSVLKQEIKVQEVTWTSSDQVVGFETERSIIIDRLIRGSKKLQAVAVVGMPGSGKTTLATQVFNDPSVTHHFHVRAWCSVSHLFQRRKVLVELLNHIQGKVPLDKNKSEDDLSQDLWRSLKRQRYLIFLDDIWDSQAFDLLKESLPDDCTESRILLTSRHSDAAIVDEEPHLLRQFTVTECLELLKRKLFQGNDWPPLLYRHGVKIAENCKGLPLTVAIVAGLLTTTEKKGWKEVLRSLRSGIISSTDQCESTIALSYEHLPDHLKPCFLSFGAFPEDYEVSTKRLIWLWIAEGFVQNSMSKSLEEVATDYLRELISRSLVMQAKERSGGGVKTCRIHDLLHEFCVRKANEENFCLVLKGYEELLLFDEPGDLRRLCVYSEPEHLRESRLVCPRLRSLLFFYPTEWDKKLDISFICLIFRLLKVLDVEQVNLTYEFPSEIEFLVQLRYLAIQASREVSPSIGNLGSLETLILRPVERRVILPDTLWNLQKLRHMCLSGATYCSGIELPVDDLDGSDNLLELDSLSNLNAYDWDTLEKQLRKFPNIRRLKCSLFDFCGEVMAFSFLSKLESLSVSFLENYTQFEFLFPETIKKLTLHGCGLSWKRISIIAELRSLEVLKLLEESFTGDTWHVEEEEFSNLKFLKLESLDIVNWIASDYQFPNLEKLVLEYCDELEEIPECLENAANLEVIEVVHCPDRIISSAKKIEECQKDMGNHVMQVHVRFPPARILDSD